MSWIPSEESWQLCSSSRRPAIKLQSHRFSHIIQDLLRSVGQVQSALVKRLSVLDKYEHILAQVNAVAMERLIDPKTQVNIQAVCEDPAILAQQLTHIELVRKIITAQL